MKPLLEYDFEYGDKCFKVDNETYSFDEYEAAILYLYFNISYEKAFRISEFAKYFGKSILWENEILPEFKVPGAICYYDENNCNKIIQAYDQVEDVDFIELDHYYHDHHVTHYDYRMRNDQYRAFQINSDEPVTPHNAFTYFLNKYLPGKYKNEKEIACISQFLIVQDIYSWKKDKIVNQEICFVLSEEDRNLYCDSHYGHTARIGKEITVSDKKYYVYKICDINSVVLDYEEEAYAPGFEWQWYETKMFFLSFKLYFDYLIENYSDTLELIVPKQ